MTIELETFQTQATDWAVECFGKHEALEDRARRVHRFVEEALELAQALNCSKSEVLELVDYVFGRPKGEPAQEVGGTMVTLACLCSAHGLDMHGSAVAELTRCYERIEKIRAKSAAKPKFGALPGPDQGA